MRRSVKSCLRITMRSADRGNLVGREGVRTIRRHAVSRHRAQGGPNRAVMCIIMKDRGVVIPEGEEMILPPPRDVEAWLAGHGEERESVAVICNKSIPLLDPNTHIHEAPF